MLGLPMVSMMVLTGSAGQIPSAPGGLATRTCPICSSPMSARSTSRWPRERQIDEGIDTVWVGAGLFGGRHLPAVDHGGGAQCDESGRLVGDAIGRDGHAAADEQL